MGRHGKGSVKKHRYSVGNTYGTLNNKSKLNEDEGNLTPGQLKIYARLPRDIEERHSGENKLGTLRPCRPTKNSTSIDQLLDEPGTSNITGNRMVNMSSLAGLLSDVCITHMTQSRTCQQPDFYIPAKEEIVQGLGSSIKIMCKNCNYESTRTKLYKTIPTPRGRPPVSMNIQLGVFLGKSALSLADVRLLFACLECTSPSETTLQSTISSAGNTYETLNEATMKKNCDLADTISKCDGSNVNNSPKVTVLTDTVYNNAPKGRGMYQPGTQSVTPMIHAETGLVLSVANYNKLCPKNNISCKECKCPVNFDQHKAMDGSEELAAAYNFKRCQDNGLSVTHIVCDGTHKVLKGIKSTGSTAPKKVDCGIHQARAQRRKYFSQSYSEELLGKTCNNNYNYVKHKLGVAIAKRCSQEIYLARKKYSTDKEFYRHIESVRNNIVPCFSGRHEKCKKASLVCRQKNRHHYHHLPYSKEITPTPSDKVKLQAVIDHRLGRGKVATLGDLKTTNKVENLHLRTLKVLPKNKTCKLNFNQKVHSAMHNQSVGVATSAFLANGALGAPIRDIRALRTMKALTRRARYFQLKKQTMKYRISRKINNLKKLNQKKLSKLQVVNAGLNTKDHDFY